MSDTMTSSRQRARALVLGLAVVYLFLAVAGFVHVGVGTFGYEEPIRLFGFLGVSTLLNFAHTFIGLVALLAAVRGGASAFAAPATIGFTAMSALGIVSRVAGDSGDPLNLTWWNVALYLVSAVLCAYVYWSRARAVASGDE